MPSTLEDNNHGDDTIVVKGEYESRGSSPNGVSAEPLVANLPSENKPRQRLESPEPYEGSPAKGEQLNMQADQIHTRRAKASVTTMEDRLQQMPELRALPWRPGVEEGADIETGGESRRKQIRFGCLLATRGQVHVPGCNSCVNGRGKFRECIALEGYFKGACASCQLSGRPNRCSIKKEDEPASSPAVSTPNGDASFDHGQQPTTSSDSRPSGPPRKRRRTSEVKRANEAKHASPKEKPQWAPQLPLQVAPQVPTQVPTQIPPRISPQVPLQPTHYQPIQWGQQPPPPPLPAQQVPETPQKAWATVNQPPPKPQLPSNGINGNGHLAQDHYRPNITTGWATVNQPQLQAHPPPQPQIHPHPPAPPVQRSMQNGGDSHGSGSYRNPERERRESTTGNEEGPGALIDSLPKSKQRQVYGLVSGLQGGIEHLQRELDALKKSLGIDDEN